jgi:hypothetical protein
MGWYAKNWRWSAWSHLRIGGKAVYCTDPCIYIRLDDPFLELQALFAIICLMLSVPTRSVLWSSLPWLRI